MRKYRYAVVAAAAIAFAMVMAGTAQAASAVLTYGSVGGPAVAVNDVLSANLASGTVVKFVDKNNSSNYVTCSTSTFTATVVTNPTAPGTATESLTGQTFSTCTPHVPGVTAVNSVLVDHLSYNVDAKSDFSVTVKPGSSGAIQTTVKLQTLLGQITCVYQATNPPGTLSGTSSNIDNSITFSNQSFTKTTGPSTCFGTALFSAKYGPVTGPGGAVFTN